MTTKTNLKLLLAVTVSAIFFSFSTIKTDQANFSGTWSLNEGKSELASSEPGVWQQKLWLTRKTQTSQPPAIPLPLTAIPLVPRKH